MITEPKDAELQFKQEDETQLKRGEVWEIWDKNSKKRAFLYGSLSGIVEPIAGILTVLVAGAVKPIMPWLLSFAAGAMIFLVVEELIPEANLDEHSNLGTVGFMFGFLVMMVLDIALG